MNRRLYLIILSIFLLLPSCLREVDLSEYSIPARMVMNADVVAGQPLSLTLSKTWFIGTKHPNLGLEGAEIQLYVNGTWAEEMVPLSTDSAGTVYCAAYIPKVGDVVLAIGNPFGVAAIVELLVRPAIQKMKRDDSVRLVRVKGIMADTFPKPSKGRRLIRAYWENGMFHLPKGLHSNGVLASMIGCNCLIDMRPGDPG